MTSTDSASDAATKSTLDGEDTRLGLIGRVSIVQSDDGSSHSLGLSGGYTTSIERDSEAYNGSLEFKVYCRIGGRSLTPEGETVEVTSAK